MLKKKEKEKKKLCRAAELSDNSLSYSFDTLCLKILIRAAVDLNPDGTLNIFEKLPSLLWWIGKKYCILK